MTTAVMKIEVQMESCCVCGLDGAGELMTPEEYDASAGPPQVPLRAMLLHLNNNKVLPDGRLCLNCIRRTTDAYEFSTTLSTRTVPPLSEKIRALRRRLHELTQKIDVFIVVGGPGVNAGGTYSEEDIIMVDKDALAAATAADDEDMEKSKNARGETVYQCSVCPLSFQRLSEFRAHEATHAADAPHSCWTCGAQFSSRQRARDHQRLHHDHTLLCYLCNTTFQSAAELRRHSSWCVGSGCPLLCPACFKAFVSEDDLSAHALAHRQADQYVCGYDGCILRFGTRGNLLSHIRAAHAAAPPAASAAPTTCAHCGRTFGSVAAMKRHARVHLRADETHPEAVEGSGEGEGVGEGEGEDHVEYLEMDALEE
ncbi:zinc finger protein 287-like isoform X2 [Plodia interpunctella]|uniref:zinc finger protein 287-like isoform X2 n=1 Tax=Plodia interpunctella TaxID=58824 RepID=UPI002367903D|nr:zinc finger protein 287-like isoform X2 [Plodia interpunctella]